jgi:fibronectin type 3 domain-containing protein
MPTIQQLPPALIVDAADEVPLSQAGATHAVSVGSLLAGTQPAILAPTGSLLGRLSLGPGGPEPVAVGTGLAVQGGNIVATGADHAAFPVEANPSATDQLVATNAGVPKLLPLATLQGWLGTIAAPGTVSFGSLPAAAVIASSDLVAISQNGTDAAITYANLIDGQTVDQASPAVPASDTDTFWVAQGSSMMLRQTFAAVWNWAAVKLPTYKLPVVELSTSTTLDGTIHNGRILVCSQPVTLSPAFVNMGSGFSCEVLNLSSGNVTFAAGIATSTGTAVLPSSQMALLRGVTYSGGNAVFAAIVSGSGVTAQPTSAPGQVTNLASTSVTTSSIALAWSAPSSGGTPTSYAILYRPSGTTAWIAAPPTAGSTATIVGGLSPGASYDFTVTGSNTAGSGPVSATVTVSTAVTLSVPGQVQNLSATAATTSGISLSWSPPASGGTPNSYSVQYAVAGTSTWSTFGTGVTGTAVSVTGLSAGSTYTFKVIAMNAAGSGAPSAALTASTASTGSSVTSVTWNLVPASNYNVGSGAIGVNVHVNPSTAAVQFGLSQAISTAPTTWVAAGYVNSDLWGAYIGTPVASGTYYVWCEGTDGSARTVYPTSFTVS